MCTHINKALIVTSQSRKNTTGGSHSGKEIHLLCPSSGEIGVPGGKVGLETAAVTGTVGNGTRQQEAGCQH